MHSFVATMKVSNVKAPVAQPSSMAVRIHRPLLVQKGSVINFPKDIKSKRLPRSQRKHKRGKQVSPQLDTNPKPQVAFHTSETINPIGTPPCGKKRKHLDLPTTSRSSTVSFVLASQRATRDDIRAIKRIKTSPICAKVSPISIPWPFQMSQGRPSKPTGLQNPLNFCYRRSLLQCMMHIPEFIQWLRLESSQHDANHNCLVCGLYRLAEAMWTARCAPQAIDRLDKTLKALAPQHRFIKWLADRDQHDSHEVFTWMVGTLVEEQNHPAALRNLFHLTSSASWTCEDCHTIHTSTTSSEFGLQLGIQTSPDADLMGHVSAYFRETVPDMVCEHPCCTSKAPRTRDVAVLAFPRILVIQLVRFSQTYDSRAGKFISRKCARRVRIPRDLDMAGFAVDGPLSKLGRAAKYRLASVVAHQGSLHGGHYIAYAEGPAGVARVNDATVSVASVEEMLDPMGGFTPYLLFYKMVQ